MAANCECDGGCGDITNVLQSPDFPLTAVEMFLLGDLVSLLLSHLADSAASNCHDTPGPLLGSLEEVYRELDKVGLHLPADSF